MPNDQSPESREPTRMLRLLADPELGGDLLLVGLALTAIIDHDMSWSCDIASIHHLAYGSRGPRVAIGAETRESETHWMNTRTARVLVDDIRRYRPPEPRRECLAPTPRKAACGKNATQLGWVTDWSTGEMHRLAACTKHRDWFIQQRKTNQETRPVVGEVPRPYANYGGVLARHFPEINWPKLWADLDPNWRPYPEREQVAPTTPTLRIVPETPSKPAKPRAPRRPARPRLRLVPTL